MAKATKLDEAELKAAEEEVGQIKEEKLMGEDADNEKNSSHSKDSE